MTDHPLGPPGSRQRRDSVRRYFRATPNPREAIKARRSQFWGMGFVVFAVALLLTTPWIFAVFAAVAGIGLMVHGWDLMRAYLKAYARAEPKPHHSEVERTLHSDLHDACRRAMKRLDLTPEDLELHSSDVTGSNPSGDSRWIANQGRWPHAVYGPGPRAQACRGADGSWLFSSYKVMVICPTGHHFAIYECVLDLVFGKRKDEDTHEYHYQDVVAVRTSTRPFGSDDVDLSKWGDLVIGQLRVPVKREFGIVVSSGDKSTVTVGIDDDDRPGVQIDLQDVPIERVIRAVRRTLREKKGGTAA
ncbi:MAG: hypothetical protein OJJ54_22515 [Pseudonocardia sp.]|nr:hypothetical protein [Pseudonocardia sp.]